MMRKSNSLNDLDNIGLIRKIAWTFCRSTEMEFNDLFQEAYVAYLKSLETYNPEKGKISTYTWCCISNHLKNYLKKERENSYTFCSFSINDSDSDVEREFVYIPSRYFENLSEDAQKIAKVILTCPGIFLSKTKEETIFRLKDIMERKGWPRSKTVIAIEEISQIYSY